MQNKKQTWPSLCQQINQALTEKKITKYQLSKLTGIAEPNIRRMLSTSSDIIPSFRSILLICNEAGISINFDGQS